MEWLEGYLTQWEGAAVIVSHDRYFLDKVANGILEMTAAGIGDYRGNYSHYLSQRQERWERRYEVFEGEKEKLVKDMEYIKKNISGQNTLQAKGKLKRLTRVVQAIEQVGMDAVVNTNWIAAGRQHDHPAPSAWRRPNAGCAPCACRTYRPPRLHLHLQADRPLRRTGHPHPRLCWSAMARIKPLFSAPDIELRRTDCAALIGPNGAGKSTFLKTILGQLQPLAGEVHPGRQPARRLLCPGARRA